MAIIEPEAFKTEITKGKVILVADNETLTIEKEDSVTIKIHSKVHDVDSDMLMKTDILHDIVSDVRHINVVPMEEKNKLESEVIDNMYELLSGELETKEMKELFMEYEAGFSSLEAKVVKNFKMILMILPALKYEKQHGKYF
ncbi:uncharacterized protein LOC109826424 [Asparagus officinalis]|uniref:uncharacterized protein LOC109826424 n=1 Tax=Asparagus officinalis TaxID=4686 RepID=UPI00098E778B|nr:uncharacterized protein LOC109826424 [Asparagus officinalis]